MLHGKNLENSVSYLNFIENNLSEEYQDAKGISKVKSPLSSFYITAQVYFKMNIIDRSK